MVRRARGDVERWVAPTRWSAAFPDALRA